MDIEKIIKNLELELLSFECRHNLVRINQLLTDDFFECGKTGKIFGKKECLEWLPLEKEKSLIARNISISLLSSDIAKVNYFCDILCDKEDLTTSFRTSLWRETESGWQMFFHQGTLIS